MKKIGIISFHRANNYGAVLQNFALQKGLKKIFPNSCVETIDYKCNFLEEPYKIPPYSTKKKNLLKEIKRIINKRMNMNGFNRLNREFNLFRDEMLKLSSPCNNDNIEKIVDEYDYIICGSDQVFNDQITGNDSIYSLGFKTNAKKIAYAASCGSTALMGKDTLRNINDINFISVREQDLKEFLEIKSTKNISIVLDPVFLLSKDEWNEYLPKERIYKKPFVFTYCVSEKTSEIVAVAKTISKEKNLDIIHLDHINYGHKGIKKYGASPLEFVQYIRDAECIVASSFHAVAFSIIFQKKFIVIPTSKTPERIVNMVKKVDTISNLYYSASEFLSHRKNILKPNTKQLHDSIEESYSFLKNSIN